MAKRRNAQISNARAKVTKRLLHQLARQETIAYEALRQVTEARHGAETRVKAGQSTSLC